MKVWKFWARGTFEELGPDGTPWKITRFGGSDESQEDAHQQAVNAAKSFFQRFSHNDLPLNQYQYSDNPAREELIEEVCSDSGERIAAITRNGYGALVLNTERAMFVDIDYEPSGLLAFLKRLLGMSANSSQESALARLDAWMQEHPEWGMRIYETAAGVRVLVTHQTFDPAAEETLSILKTLGSDRLYVQLCRKQECFRARLTPKPWRVGVLRPTQRYPFVSDEEEQVYRNWVQGYEDASRPYAICRLLGTRGSRHASREIEQVVALHDKYCLQNADETLA